jgi:hypothetical protein
MDDAEARAILREHGEEPPARGKLGADWTGRAETYREGAAPPGDDYDEGVTADDFTTVAGDPPDPAPVAERKPRRVRASAAARPSIRERFTKARG